MQVLNICNRIMDELIPDERADRAFRVKFPDDVMQDNLAGQLWFGAEVIALMRNNHFFGGMFKILVRLGG